MTSVFRIFLIIGFLIPIYKIANCRQNIKNIKKFKNLLINFSLELNKFPENKENINKILSEIIQNLFIYENSNAFLISFNDELNKCLNLMTRDWIFNIEYFFQDDERYPFKVLSTRIKFSINECDASLSKNFYILQDSYKKLFPIFYLSNIVFEFKSFFFDEFVANNSTHVRWGNNIFEIVGFIANIATVISFFFYIFGIKF